MPTKAIDRWQLATSENTLASAAREVIRGPVLIRLETAERRVVKRAIRYRTLLKHRDSAEGAKNTYEGKFTRVHRCNTALDNLGRAAHRLRKKTDS